MTFTYLSNRRVSLANVVRSGLTRPGIPTLGTVATASPTSVTVAYTAVTGNPAVTSYTAVSNPGGITGTLSQSGAGTITVSGLTAGVGYTFSVYASNALGASISSSPSAVTTPGGVPRAPTVGTATVVDATTATVTYTAPADNGGYAITKYTAVSTPGGIVGTLSQAGSGTITVSGLTGNTSYTFTVYATNSAGNGQSSGTSNIMSIQTVEYLVVAGGGGGGTPRYGNNGAGGGGAGGLLTGSTVFSFSTPYTVTVGAGGVPVINQVVNGSVGANSVFSTITATGGGSGYGWNGTSSLNGGSGGGGGTGIVGQGKDGGGINGGGGGAGTVGGAANGGDGLPSSITGVSTYYAGGGGSYQTGSLGGLGGGGNTASSYTIAGGSGSPNTGSGGAAGTLTGASIGGQQSSGGSGGTGVVILAYPNTYPAITTISAGLTYDQPTRTGYRVYRFTAGTGTVTW